MVSDLRISQGITRKQPFTISVNGEETLAYPGESLATVLMAAGWKMFRHTSLSAAPRGMFCGMGLCFDCLVTVNGQPNVRACHTLARLGDVVERQ